MHSCVLNCETMRPAVFCVRSHDPLVVDAFGMGIGHKNHRATLPWQWCI